MARCQLPFAAKCCERWDWQQLRCSNGMVVLPYGAGEQENRELDSIP